MGTRLGLLARDLAKIMASGTPAAGGGVPQPFTQGSFTGTLTGYASPPTGSVKYAIAGKIVTLNIPVLSGTSNATTMTLTGAPVALKPVTAKTVLVIATDNGTAAVATAVIGTDGVLTFSKGLGTGGAWTGSGTKGVALLQVSYSLD